MMLPLLLLYIPFLQLAELRQLAAAVLPSRTPVQSSGKQHLRGAARLICTTDQILCYA
jgi:hypothetical protein